MPLYLRITNYAGAINLNDTLTYSQLDNNFVYLDQRFETGSFTGSLYGTSSWSENTSNAVSSSYALTASYSPNYLPLVGGGTILGNLVVAGTASIAYLHVTYESASVVYSTGSNQFGDDTTDTQLLVGTVTVTGSLRVTGSLNAPDITGSLYGTSSWSQNTVSASYAATASYVKSADSSSYPIAVTGSTLYSSATSAGAVTVGTTQNILLGSNAGHDTGTVSQANFIGASAGHSAGQANSSNFLGANAGYSAASASNSNFIGNFAGYNADFADRSNFVGNNAGNAATSASYSNFVGHNAGRAALSASYSTLLGYQAGYRVAGVTRGLGSNNVVIGTNVTLEEGRVDSINLGGLIFASGSYSVTSGDPFSGSANGRVGINQPNPQFSLDVSGSGRFTNGVTASLHGTSSWSNNTVSASYALTASLAVSASQAQNAVSSSYPIAISGSTIFSLISSDNTGFSTNQGIFLGLGAGNGATSAINSIFFGSNSGRIARNSTSCIFIGVEAGTGVGYNTSTDNTVLIGSTAGYFAENPRKSNFIGLDAGSYAHNARNSNFIGETAGRAAANASYSTFIGYRAGINDTGNTANSVGRNNIIIGTNITLPVNTIDSINLGGLIFGTGSYYNNNEFTQPFSGSANGRIGINQPNPQFSLDVSGSGRFTNGITGSLFGTSSWAQNVVTASYALTASFLLGGASVNTSSLVTTASFNAYTSSNSSTFAGTASLAVSASHYVSESIWELNTQTANYVLTLADAGKMVMMNVGSSNTVTIPENATEAFPVGTYINFLQKGTGITSFTTASNAVTLNSANGWKRINAQYGAATIFKEATNTWNLIGNINA